MNPPIFVEEKPMAADQEERRYQHHPAVREVVRDRDGEAQCCTRES